ncbi:cation efflux family protein [Striga asiatica]|uniref:Cation efflux family protein n=1 Tax=Striga asiatica TaxID=4170 RepID=A0A5A7Q4T4_STRAF|nr:cation efflux family protein [Striga asiatica]
MPGRPKKYQRKMGKDEDNGKHVTEQVQDATPNQVRLSKKGVTMRCSICKQPNHNSRGCHKNTRTDVPAPIQKEPIAKKRMRKSPSKSIVEENDFQRIRKSPRLKEKAQIVEGVSEKRPQKEKGFKAGVPTKKDNEVGKSSQDPGKGKRKETIIVENEGVKTKLPVKRSLRLQAQMTNVTDNRDMD